MPGGVRPTTPAEAWAKLLRGNARFMSGQLAHPNQDIEYRAHLADAQAPFAVFFGCADSRVAAEMVFDQGLGDLFVIRTAGHVVDPAVLGSIEFAVTTLHTPLVVILGHDTCGSVKAAMNAIAGAGIPDGYVRDIVERVTPSVLTAFREGRHSAEEVEAEHVRQTMHLIASRSRIVSDAVAAGTLGMVGAEYALHEGRASVIETLGPVT